MNEWDKLWDTLPETELWRAYIPSYYLSKIKAEGDKLQEELETIHKVNKSISDEKEKNRQEYIELYKKLEAIRKILDAWDWHYPPNSMEKITEVLSE